MERPIMAQKPVLPTWQGELFPSHFTFHEVKEMSGLHW